MKKNLEHIFTAERIWLHQVLIFIIVNMFFVVFGYLGALSILVSVAGGLLYPYYFRIRRKKKFLREVSYELPHLMDMLSLSVEAGLDVVSAMNRFCEKGGESIMRRELTLMLGKIKLGLRRVDAFKDLKKRISHPGVDSFLSLLIQAEQLGAQVAPILKVFSAKLRNDRFQEAERLGNLAAQKLLIPLIFCIMPAVFIVIFGPLVVMWQTGSFDFLTGVGR